MPRNVAEFQTIYSEGGLLPPDLLRRLIDPKGDVPGLKAEDYGLPKGDRLNDAIAQSWNVLRRHWSEFAAQAKKLSRDDHGTGLTNDKWTIPLLRELGFGMLPSGAGQLTGGRAYPISRMFGNTPVHLVGCGLSLDRRTAGARGAATQNPHGLVQEFLNRKPESLWGIVSNGLEFRLLRDSQALSRQSFLEFDLEAMFVGEIYSDFVVLWLTAHATRFQEQEASKPESCWLEEWTRVAAKDGTRILGDLRQGVEKALETLGQGFVGHQQNHELREALRSGSLSLSDFHAQLLRVVYRLIFLFVAEDRVVEGAPLLHSRDDSPEAVAARARFARYYSTNRLRRIAADIRGSRHGDLWDQFRLLVDSLSGDEKCETARRHLALPALGGFLWSHSSTRALSYCSLTNSDFLEAIRRLAFTRHDRSLRPVDYRNLGAEELGGVYEGLLALTPQIGEDGKTFSFVELAGNERKTSGSYYTPDSLVQCLLDSSLDPVVQQVILGKKGEEAEQAILGLRVCDPAVGSGHFLVGAAHRLARHLAQVRGAAEGDSHPSPLLYQHALREVIGRCLYGVDLNPMAAELCRISLWLEALEPGKPLSFLDHHIRVGNSLLGATPELIAAGVPDDAFTAIEGDDKKACAVLKRRNRAERFGLGPLFAEQEAETQERLLQTAAALEELPDDRPEDIRAKELALRRHEQTQDYRHKKQLADAWCAAFVIKKHFREVGRDDSASGITQRCLNDIASDRPLPADLSAEIVRLAEQYQFLHWPLAFPEVFARGGFDCVLGNPPWERVKLQEKEWFAERVAEIANAPNAAARKRLIEGLKTGNPLLHQQFLADSRKAEGESHLLRNSGRYPLCGRGDINVYSVFAEGMRSLLSDRGRVGCVLPTGIATDDTTKFFFQDLVETRSLVSLFDFENRRGLFPAVDSRMKFCLLTSGRGLRPMDSVAEFVFFAHAVEDLRDPERRFVLSVEDITLLNPNTRTCPTFRSRRDADLTKAIYRRVPVLWREDADEANPWGISYLRMFDMANDSDLFRGETELAASSFTLAGNSMLKGSDKYLPLYEAKMADLYDHRAARVVISKTAMIRQGQPEDLSSEEHADPDCLPTPRVWVSESAVRSRLPVSWRHDWVMAWRRVSSATNERTVLASVLPVAAVGDSLFLFFPAAASQGVMACLLANVSQSPFDFVARQKMGGVNLSYFIFSQLPALSPESYENACAWADGTQRVREWLLHRVLELTYTARDLEPFAKDCGYAGPSFRWDEARRFVLRCELDAAFFQLYLPADAGSNWRLAEGETANELAALKASFPTPREAVAYMMDTFTIVRRKDEEKFSDDFRTKRVVLEIYDAMQEAIRTGRPYQTRLDPPPADPSCCHPVRA